MGKAEFKREISISNILDSSDFTSIILSFEYRILLCVLTNYLTEFKFELKLRSSYEIKALRLSIKTAGKRYSEGILKNGFKIL